jgi:hypothetical protein
VKQRDRRAFAAHEIVQPDVVTLENHGYPMLWM